MIEEVPMITESRQVEKGLMKAIVRDRYGSPDVLQLKEVEKPAPNDVRGVLVKIYASSVNPADRYDVRGPPFLIRLVLPLFRMGMGLRRPKEAGVGSDFAGRVEAVRSNVTQFKPGDEVYGVCKAGYAEYGTARENRISLKPANRSFEESAAVPIAGLTALQALRNHGHIKPGQKVLVNGAGGGVGTFAVQIAKSFETEVTAVTSVSNDLAIWTANVPTPPPAPLTSTFCPGLMCPWLRRACNAVSPAIGTAADSSKERFAGFRAILFSRAVPYSA